MELDKQHTVSLPAKDYFDMLNQVEKSREAISENYNILHDRYTGENIYLLKKDATISKLLGMIEYRDNKIEGLDKLIHDLHNKKR